MLKQMERAVAIANIKYPNNKIWIFDQSRALRIPLNVNKINVNPGGLQPQMRDTICDGKVQRMAFNDGQE